MRSPFQSVTLILISWFHIESIGVLIMNLDVYSPVYWFYVLLTAIIPGLLATWLGVGGCFLRIPMLTYLFGVSIKTAYCINQATIALTTIPGVIVHWRSGHVYSRGLVVSAISAVVGVALGAYVVAKIIPTLALKGIFGAACIGIGIYITWKTLKARKALRRRVTVREVKWLEAGARLSLLMFLAGFATGLCGFGGGIYYVPIFMALSYPTHVAIGTSSAQMIATASIGSTVLSISGYMNVVLLASIGIPTLVASWIGAKLSVRSPPWLLRLVYSLSIIGAGAFVVYDALSKLYGL